MMKAPLELRTLLDPALQAEDPRAARKPLPTRDLHSAFHYYRKSLACLGVLSAKGAQ